MNDIMKYDYNLNIARPYKSFSNVIDQNRSYLFHDIFIYIYESTNLKETIDIFLSQIFSLSLSVNSGKEK